MKRALVTGGAGYIGRRLAARLLDDGVDVHLLLRRGPSAAALKELPGSPVFHFHDGTIEGLQRILAAAAPDTIFHLAAKSLSEHAPRDVPELLASNVILGTQLAEAAAGVGVKRFINTATFWQHWRGKGYDPTTLYAATKQAFEDLLAYYAVATPLKTATLVLYDVYGPADPRPKLLSQLESARRANRRVDLSPGRQRVDMVFVDDVVEAFLRAAALLERKPSASGRRWAVTSGRALPLRAIVAEYAKVAGPVEVCWGGRPYRTREVFKPWRGPTLPGWKPRVSLAQGLKRVVKEAS